MAYKMQNPGGVKCPRVSAFYVPYSPSAYVLTIMASVHGLWAGVDFQKFDEAIGMLKIEFKKGIGNKNR